MQLCDFLLSPLSHPLLQIYFVWCNWKTGVQVWGSIFNLVKKLVSKGNKGRRQNDNQDHVSYGISPAMVHSWSFSTEHRNYFQPGSGLALCSDHLSLWCCWLCNSHSALKGCHLSADGFYFLTSTNRTSLMLTRYFSQEMRAWAKLCVPAGLYRHLPSLYPRASSSRKLEKLESFNRRQHSPFSWPSSPTQSSTNNPQSQDNANPAENRSPALSLIQTSASQTPTQAGVRDCLS